MVTTRYQAIGVEVEFEPGTRGRVLRNLISIARLRDMSLTESQALEIAQDLALERYDVTTDLWLKTFAISTLCGLAPSTHRRVNTARWTSARAHCGHPWAAGIAGCGFGAVV